MTWIPVLLWANAAMFVAYGLVCLFMPALPADYAGFELATPSGTVEVVAMYGGLQTGFGVLLAMGARDPAMRSTALWAMAVLVGGLFAARVLGLAMHGTSSYNIGAAAYEGTVTALAVIALRSGPAKEATP